MKRILNIAVLVALSAVAQIKTCEKSQTSDASFDVETNRELYRAYREMRGEDLNKIPEIESERTTYNEWGWGRTMEDELASTGRLRKTARIFHTTKYQGYRRLNPLKQARYFGWALGDDNCTVYSQEGQEVTLNPMIADMMIQKLDAIDERAKAGAINFDQVMREREQVVARVVSSVSLGMAIGIGTFGQRNPRVVPAWRADERGYAWQDAFLIRQEKMQKKQQEAFLFNEEKMRIKQEDMRIKQEEIENVDGQISKIIGAIDDARKNRAEAEKQGNKAKAQEYAFDVGNLKAELKNLKFYKAILIKPETTIWVGVWWYNEPQNLDTQEQDSRK